MDDEGGVTVHFRDRPDIDPNGDAVENFFNRLPPPTKDCPTALTVEPEAELVQQACELLLSEFFARPSVDPDAKYILEHAAKVARKLEKPAYILKHLAFLAISKGVNLADDDQSNKACQLCYWRWIAQGRRDETSPFSTGSEKNPPLNDSKVFLPEPATFQQCAACGKEGATNKCSGCLVRTDDHLTFATAYCGKECQTKHWNAHKASCKQMQQTYRAMLVFQDIFEHFRSVAFYLGYTAKYISEKDGMVFVRLEGDSTKAVSCRKWSRFPHELAASSDIAKAVLMHARCSQVLTDARALFEAFIRPSCLMIERVGFEAKNIERPVHFIHQDWDVLNSMQGHEVIRVTLACGNMVVLDPTSMQFGWKENFAPWTSYRKHRISHIGLIETASKPPASQFSRSDLSKTPTVTAAASGKEMIAQTVALGLLNQIKKRFGGVSTLLRLKEGEFTAARTAVAASAHRGLSMVMEEFEKPSHAIVYHNPIANGISTGQEDWEGMEVVWCSTRDQAMAKRKPNKLHNIREQWKARWDKVVEIKLPVAK